VLTKNGEVYGMSPKMKTGSSGFNSPACTGAVGRGVGVSVGGAGVEEGTGVLGVAGVEVGTGLPIKPQAREVKMRRRLGEKVRR
jgi:hypothetical protein